MKKIKKILLAFAPLGAIAIATPIALTACSTTTTNPDTGIKPSFDKDDTNKEDFTLEQNSKAQEILNKYKAAQGEAAAEKVLTDELAGFPKKETGSLVTDVLNMWSNNNWFMIKKTAADEKVKETFISKINIKKAEVGDDSKASFDVEYQNTFTDKNGRTFEATQLLKADKKDVDANTTSIEIPKSTPIYKIDGEDQSLSASPTSFFDATTPMDNTAKNNFETILKKDKVELDAKSIFKTYITNHNITHADAPSTPEATAPIWNQTEIAKDSALTYTSETELVMQLSATGSSNWGNCVNTTPYNTIVTVMKNATYANRLKGLITTNDYENPTLEYGAEIKGDNSSDMDITIKFTKKTSSQGTNISPTLTFKIKGFKKTV